MPTKSQDLVASKALGSKIEAAGAELPPKKEKKKRKKQQADVGADMLGADSNGSTRKASENSRGSSEEKRRESPRWRKMCKTTWLLSQLSRAMSTKSAARQPRGSELTSRGRAGT